jgi:hypothetical protein
MTGAPNWSDEDIDQVERDELGKPERDNLGKAEREADEHAQQAREPTKRPGVQPDRAGRRLAAENASFRDYPLNGTGGRRTRTRRADHSRWTAAPEPVGASRRREPRNGYRSDLAAGAAPAGDRRRGARLGPPPGWPQERQGQQWTAERRPLASTSSPFRTCDGTCGDAFRLACESA